MTEQKKRGPKAQPKELSDKEALVVLVSGMLSNQFTYNWDIKTIVDKADRVLREIKLKVLSE